MVAAVGFELLQQGAIGCVHHSRELRGFWGYDAGGPVAGGVISYAVNGKQYVAAISGFVSPFFQGIGGGSTTVVIFSLEP